MYQFYSYSIWKNLKYFFHVNLDLEGNARKIMHLSLSLNQLVNLLIIVNLRDRGIFGDFEKSLWYCSFNGIVQFCMYLINLILGNETMCMNGLSNKENNLQVLMVITQLLSQWLVVFLSQVSILALSRSCYT